MREHLNLHVFRRENPAISTASLAARLTADLGALAAVPTGEQARAPAERALIHAGEIACLLADHGSPHAAEAAGIVDALADLAVGTPRPAPRAGPPTSGLPGWVRPSAPEGFAYYGATPASFARLAETLEVPGAAAAVVGIRTIGLTLGAVVAAALRKRGVRVEGASARPVGHPYDRALHPDAALGAWMAAQRDRGAVVFVVDEGPGLSGSTFLAVAEALIRAGVEPRRVHLLGTWAPDPATLVCRDAARRFSALGGLSAAPVPPPPGDAAVEVSAGAWRSCFYDDEARWPAVWPEHERRKFLSADRLRLHKFEGLGRWGDAVRDRSMAVAEAGFGPRPLGDEAGFTCYPVLDGRPLDRADRSAARIDRLAAYCAFRAAAFAAPGAETEELEAMVRHDAGVLFGRPVALTLPVASPVVADARLAPHEWIGTPDGGCFKVDAATHGDDELFPGPVDIAWDLAGAIVEWDLNGEARRAFLDRYARLSGDRAEGRLGPHLAAYAVLSAARAAMASATLGGAEGARLDRERARYARIAEEALVSIRSAAPSR